MIGARTQWEIWNVEGNFTLEGSDTLWVKSGFFTSCELPEPHYRFESDKMKLIFNNIVVGWPVRVYFGEVPVFWFPFIAQDIRQGRHSGLLTLRFGVNDIVRNQSGHNRHISNVGYYWAPNDYADATLTFDFYPQQDRIVSYLNTRYHRRYSFEGRLGLKYNRDVPQDLKETAVELEHRQTFLESMRVTARARFISSMRPRASTTA